MTATANFIGTILVLVIKFAVCEQNNSETDDKLIFAHILFRHGDRNILRINPNHPWKNEQMYWPEGYGQLTDIGKQQQYELGTYLRKRYFSLLPNNGSYHPENIFCQSSDVNRVIQSVAYAMVGMFPERSVRSENGCPLMQLVPIHTIPDNMDHILNYGQPCKLYDISLTEFMSHEPEQSLKNNQSLIDYLEKHTGQKFRSYDAIRALYDTLWIAQLKNFSLPLWTKNIFYPGCDMEKLVRYSKKFPTDTKQLARLQSGFLLREMLERFSMKINSTLVPDQSLWVYSGHDFTISCFLNSLGLFESAHIPAYSSCLFIELHETSSGYHVEIYYKQEQGDDIVPLEPLFIPNCGKKCPLNKMYELYEEIIPTGDFDTECQNNGASNPI